MKESREEGVFIEQNTERRGDTKKTGGRRVTHCFILFIFCIELLVLLVCMAQISPKVLIRWQHSILKITSHIFPPFFNLFLRCFQPWFVRFFCL